MATTEGKIDWDFRSEGWMAHRRGEANCPYEEGSAAHRFWNAGWYDRYREVTERDAG